MKEIAKSKVLAVIYEPAVRNVIERLLTRIGFNPEIVSTLEEAREKIGELTPSDAILTDWTDGSRAGTRLEDRKIMGREIVELAQGKGIRKIVVMNGGSVDKEDLKALRERGIDIISKPFEVAELINAIRGEVSEIEAETPKFKS